MKQPPSCWTHLAVLSVLQDIGGVEFVQIGGFDGVQYDHVFRHATLFGWRGVVAEPQAHAFEKLKAAYAIQPHVQCLQVAVTEYDGNATLFRPAHHGQSSAYASLSSEQLMRLQYLRGAVVSENVPCVTPLRLLEASRINNPSLLVIDTEGHDWIILRNWPWSSSKPEVIIFEYTHLSAHDRANAYQQLQDLGYFLFAAGEHDVIAVGKTLARSRLTDVFQM